MATGTWWLSASRPTVLGAFSALCFAIVAVVGAGAAAAEQPELLSTSPSVGAVVEELTQIDLRFAQPVTIDPDSIELTSLSGRQVATGEPVMLSDSTVAIPVLGETSGPVILTWSAESLDGANMGPGAIYFDVGVVENAVLDVEGATSAARGGEFSRVLVVVAALTVSGGALVLLVRGIRRRKTAVSPGVVPVRAIVAAGGCALTLGGALGIVMTVRNVSITASGNSFLNASATDFGTWSILAIVVGVVTIVFALVRGPRIVGLISSGVVGVAALALVVGLAVAAPPAIPEGDFDKRVPVGEGLQLSVRVSPAAVGRNDFTIGIGGPAEAMVAATDAPPTLTFRPLDGSIGEITVPLIEQEDGGLAANAVLLPKAGRWRGELNGSTGLRDGEGVFDFNVQANPRLTDGQR